MEGELHTMRGPRRDCLSVCVVSFSMYIKFSGEMGRLSGIMRTQLRPLVQDRVLGEILFTLLDVAVKFEVNKTLQT